MNKLIDFHCRYAEFSGISKEVTDAHGLIIPDAYKTAADIAKLAIATNTHVLPFDPVLEAENIGGLVKYDESNLGPRKAEDIVTSIDELAALPLIDVTKGRLSETINALSILRENGIDATAELHGPITVINGVADIMKILMGWRKKPEIMDAFFQHMIVGLVDYAKALKQVGCNVIYYTDSPGSLDIIGPKYAKQLVEGFTVPLLKALSEALGDDCLVHLCPKTSLMLAGFEKAQWKKLTLDQPMPYQEACQFAVGKINIAGQRCRKDTNLEVSVINYLELTE
ncbi:uroporphyrinogen-III decarboxylase [Clostridiales Family XIII bacterium PM5-7]